MITIVLADDHQVVRQGLRALFEAEPDFAIIGEANDGPEAVKQVETLRPDVLVLDLMMPGLHGLEVTRQISKRFPDTRVIVLSMHSSEGYVLEALRNGASGYVLKASNTDELIEAVRQVVGGRRYLSPPLSERAVQVYLEKSEVGAVNTYETLTSREREVLQLAAEGRNNTEIAARLFISPSTAMTHRARLMNKLGLHSQTDLVLYAVRRGLISTED